MSRDRAAYMREYRRRQRSELVKNTTLPSEVVAQLLTAQDRIRVLEAEVSRLKRDLATRQPTAFRPEFHPVPKPSQRRK